ncbi:MAG: hypothetical protein R3D57_13620 [Hyphomicrobiaceae bacterium]
MPIVLRSALAAVVLFAATAASAQTVRWITPQDTKNGRGCLQACAARGLMPVIVGVRDDSSKAPYFLCVGDPGQKRGGYRPGFNLLATGSDQEATCNVVHIPDTGASEAIASTEFKCLCGDQQLFPIEGSSP